jgi:uncharacterized phage-associated protein
MYTARSVSYYFLLKAFEEKREITVLKLLKLLFLAYGHYYAIHRKKLFSEEINAWKFGPVVRSVYDEFKKYGNEPLQDLLYNEDFAGMVHWEVSEFLAEDLKFLDLVWGAYKSMSPYQLVSLTHLPGSPWSSTTSDGEDIGWNKVIPDTDIYDYFVELPNKVAQVA